jgi:hypothetical protein
MGKRGEGSGLYPSGFGGSGGMGSAGSLGGGVGLLTVVDIAEVRGCA